MKKSVFFILSLILLMVGNAFALDFSNVSVYTDNRDDGGYTLWLDLGIRDSALPIGEATVNFALELDGYLARYPAESYAYQGWPGDVYDARLDLIGYDIESFQGTRFQMLADDGVNAVDQLWLAPTGFRRVQLSENVTITSGDINPIIEWDNYDPGVNLYKLRVFDADNYLVYDSGSLPYTPHGVYAFTPERFTFTPGKEYLIRIEAREILPASAPTEPEMKAMGGFNRSSTFYRYTAPVPAALDFSNVSVYTDNRDDGGYTLWLDLGIRDSALPIGEATVNFALELDGYLARYPAESYAYQGWPGDVYDARLDLIGYDIESFQGTRFQMLADDGVNAVDQLWLAPTGFRRVQLSENVTITSGDINPIIEWDNYDPGVNLYKLRVFDADNYLVYDSGSLPYTPHGVYAFTPERFTFTPGKEYLIRIEAREILPASAPTEPEMKAMGGFNRSSTFYRYTAPVPGTVPLFLAIDIKPGKDPNSIDPRRQDKISVAVLSTMDFYAPTEVDLASLTFGATGDEESLAFCNPSPEDVNDDGYDDVVCYFYTQETGFMWEDTEGILRGQTMEGDPIEGRDTVRIVPSACKHTEKTKNARRPYRGERYCGNRAICLQKHRKDQERQNKILPSACKHTEKTKKDKIK